MDVRYDINCLYIDNLPASFQIEDLWALFERFGPLFDCRIFPKTSPKGDMLQYGFVNFINKEDMDIARVSMNKKEFYGRKLK